MTNDELLASLLMESATEAMKREATAFDELAGPFQTSLILFGAGNLGKKSLLSLRKEGIEPLAFTDNNPRLWNTVINGVKVYSPQEASHRFGNSAAFIVTVWGAGREPHMESIISQLKILKCKTIIPFSFLFWKYHKHFLPYYCLDLPSNILLEKDDIALAYNIWCDDLSQHEYLSQIEWRLYSDWSKLSDPIDADQYFVDDLFISAEHETFIDCGAFDGNTLKIFLARNGASFDNIIAFEPDPHNFAALKVFTSSLNECLQNKIAYYPYAVGGKREIVRFDATGDMGASVQTTGALQVDSFPLDTILAHMKPTFIKMDIEGSEMDALSGAKRVIAEYHPVLAVSAYHKFNDLWKVPLHIKSLCAGYHFFLRSHGNECWDSVCYAIPEERLKIKRTYSKATI